MEEHSCLLMDFNVPLLKYGIQRVVRPDLMMRKRSSPPSSLLLLFSKSRSQRGSEEVD